MGNRIGVVTYWGIFNLGSYLQAFALQKTLNKLGYEPCVLICKQDSKPAKIIRKIKLITKLILHPTAISTFRELRRMGLSSISVIPQETKQKFFEDERDVNTVLTSESDLKKCSKDYYAFICGSDQIWNPLGFEQRGYKYLRFAPKYKRIAYAPSFGVNYIPFYNRSDIKKGLMGMSSLSIREPEGAKIVKEMTGKECPVVLDPTLLIKAEEWSMYERPINGLPDDFSICFFLNAPSDQTIESVIRLNKNKPLFCFPDIYGFKTYPFATKVSIGPRELLFAIRKASLVFTDSFHGTAFSVIFNKRFVVFKRTHKEAYNQFNRIENILMISGKCNAICNNDTNYTICENQVDFPSIDKAIAESMDYLYDAINNVI